MTTGEVELARVEWFNTQDGQPDEPAEELDPPEVATMTATPDGIESFFYVWSPGDPVTASALLTAPWPEVLDHAPPAALLAALARKVADTEQAENYDVTRRVASLVSMTEAVPEVWKP